MDEFITPKPMIASGWLRAALYIISFIVISLIAGILFLLGMHKGIHDLAAMNELMKLDTFHLAIPLFFILTLLVTYIFRSWVDKESFISLGLDISGRGREAVAGTALAVFIICISAFIIKLTGHLRWMDILFDPKVLFLSYGSLVLISFSEELIFRGYILNNLLDSLHKWSALLVSALLFMIFHWTSIGFFPLINTFILGIILGLNYIYTKNLWFSICFHIAWKFMQGPVLGFSGDDSFQTLIQTEINGDQNITGGTNGLEGSFILTAISLLSLLALYLIYQRKLNPQSQPVPGRI